MGEAGVYVVTDEQAVRVELVVRGEQAVQIKSLSCGLSRCVYVVSEQEAMW